MVHFSGALRSRSALPILLGLLAPCILINYVDRGNLAVAAPLLKDELHLSTTQIGTLITAFCWTYTAVMAVSGWIVDRFDVNCVLAAGFVLWSAVVSHVRRDFCSTSDRYGIMVDAQRLVRREECSHTFRILATPPSGILSGEIT